MDGIENKLKIMNNRMAFIIRTYCNSIGCKNCPLLENNGDCEATTLQNDIMTLEFKDYNKGV